MLNIVLTENGHHVSDFHVLDYVDSVFYEYDFGGRKDMTVEVSNQLILDAFVLRLLEEKFPSDEINFFAASIKLEFNPIFGLCAPDNVPNFKIGSWETINSETMRLISRNLNLGKE